jgi:hypothetical protein
MRLLSQLGGVVFSMASIAKVSYMGLSEERLVCGDCLKWEIARS